MNWANTLLGLTTVLSLLLLQITVHPPQSTISGAGSSGAISVGDHLTASELTGGDTDSSLGSNEGLVKLLSKRARVKLGKHVLSTESLDTSSLGLLSEASLLSFVLTNALVHLLESEASLSDLRVLLTLSL